MAFGLPKARFLGIDLAQKPLANAITLTRELGMANIEFRCADILDLGPDLGEFDYIVIPGLYSWVPANVRDKLLELCGQCLALNGVAIVSYNAYPGCYASKMTREMMAYHARAMEDPKTKIKQSRGLLKVLIECQTQNNPYKMLLERESKRIVKYFDGVFYHDDLNPHYHPVFFHQFIEHAAQHGLQYLGERYENGLDPAQYPEEIRAVLQGLEGCSVIEREQYLDFIHERRFRQTFLCRDGVTPNRAEAFHQIEGLLVGMYRDLQSNVAVETGTGISFEAEEGMLATTNHPLLIAAMSHLLKASPTLVPFSELLPASRAAMEEIAVVTDDLDHDTQFLKEFVLGSHMAGLLDLGTFQPRLADGRSERPIASALARAMVRTSRIVPSLRHHSVAFDDELGKRLLELLDGTRDRSDLLRELNGAIASGSAQLPAGVLSVTPELLEERLTALAQLALLTG
jgi:hypothetical protein